MHQFRVYKRGPRRRRPTSTNTIASDAHTCVALGLPVDMEVAAARYFNLCQLHHAAEKILELQEPYRRFVEIGLREQQW